MPSSLDFSGFNAKQDTPLMYAGEADEPGVYLDWDRSGLASVAHYHILRSPTFDGNYELIDTVDFPMNEYLDDTGRPEYFYRIAEYDASNTLLGTSAPIIGEEILIRASLRYQLKDYMKLRVYREKGSFNTASRTAAQFTFQSWNYWPRPVLRIDASSNGGLTDPMFPLSETVPITSTLDSSASPDYASGLRYMLDYQGRAYFIDGTSQTPVSIMGYNTIEADYAIRAFTCTEMNSALRMALQDLNALPGTTKYRHVHQTPYWYETALVTGAAYMLLRGLMTSFTTREKRMIMEDPDGTTKGLEDLKEIMKMYQSDWNDIKKTLPKSQYPRTMIVIVPQFQLPGGRSRFFRSLFKADDVL